MPLKRDLGLLDVFCIASGAMISSGLFVLPAIVYGQVGSWVFVCYLLAAVLMVPALLSKAELATAIPKSGGTYFLIDRGVGPAFGTLGGIAAWSSLAFKTAFALLGMGLFFQYAFPQWGLSEWDAKLIAIACTTFFTVLNILGTKHAGRLQVVIVLALLGLLAAYAITGLPCVDYARCRPQAGLDYKLIIAGAGMVFVSFGGVTKVASIGEEVKNPGRTLATGMILSFVVVSILYVVIVFVTVGIVDRETLLTTYKPIAEGGGILWGPIGGVLMGIASMLAFISTANAGILATSRVPMAMAQDGLVPDMFAKVSEKRGTPVVAILFTATFVALALLMPLDLFVKTASTLMILLFILEMFSLVLMHESGMENYRPVYRSPFYPWLQVVGIIAYMFLLVELGTTPLLIAVAILGAAFAWYALFVQKHVVRESALTHLAKRIAAASFKDHDLEEELEQIVHERDRTEEDDFDRLIRKCPILDIHEPIGRDDLFHAAASWLGHDLEVPPERIQELLSEREEASSTIIRPGLAIPHMIVEGTNLFDIMLVRCKDGIDFGEGEEQVHTVFLLIGSKDVRDVHLRALMAVAEIAQDPEFERKWLKAKGEEQLRTLVLRSKRRREVIMP